MSQHDVMIREFQTGDIDSIKRMMDTTINVSYAIFPPEYRQHWMDEHHSSEQILAEATEGFTLIIECEGSIIGTGNLLQNLIRSVFIHPGYQQRGFGTEVIHRLEAHAKNHAVNTIHVTALTPSKPFFTKLGYQTISEHHFGDETLKQFRYYRMEKTI